VQGGEQGLGIGGVGARQRHEDPARRPTGEHALAHRLLHGLGQLREQRQTPTDPTGVLAQGRRQGALAQPLGQGRRQHPSLLDGLKGAALMAGQHLQQGRRQWALPHLDLGGIAAEALQCRPALVAVDQHPTGALGHDHQRHPLAIGVDGGHQPADLLGALHPGLGIGGIELMQIERNRVHGAAFMAHTLARTLPPGPLNRVYCAEHKQVFAVDTSTFAIRPAPRLDPVSACR